MFFSHHKKHSPDSSNILTSRHVVSELFYPNTGRLRWVNLNRWRNESKLRTCWCFKPFGELIECQKLSRLDDSSLRRVLYTTTTKMLKMEDREAIIGACGCESQSVVEDACHPRAEPVVIILPCKRHDLWSVLEKWKLTKRIKPCGFSHPLHPHRLFPYNPYSHPPIQTLQ
ncbi:hypothetical protein RRG08_028951 [Elysia crispata]|uniref:Uncharacterized protein n=1 Tax=Elysia crispata TaxID=231223 RepID=A0AAE1E3T0_9GAST|nr:hypothetical protein RRG08_028951 [Elysia crispata]